MLIRGKFSCQVVSKGLTMSNLQVDLKKILEVQELDMKMIRLMRLKKDRNKELGNIHSLRKDLNERITEKSSSIKEIKKECRVYETRIQELEDRLKKLSKQQAAVKKLEEFNALSQQITSAEREKSHTEQHLSDLTDKLEDETQALDSLEKSLKTTEDSSQVLEQELLESIGKINEEGRGLKVGREALENGPSAEIMSIYERLLANKRDRVVVSIENRVCSGCHIVLTAQHENMVRRGEKLVTCEHCSRILYWTESLDGIVATDEASTPKRRRRRIVSS